MSENQTNEAEQQQPDPAQETDWKAQARKWEERAKQNKTEADANKAAAARLAELEEAQKTDQQKLQDQLAEYEKRATAAERDRERLAAIAKHSIPEEYQGLVQGDTPEALDASAVMVGELIAKSTQPAQQDSASYVIPLEGGTPALPLNGDGIESALKKALGIR